jgi:hypothetical protein
MEISFCSGRFSIHKRGIKGNKIIHKLALLSIIVIFAAMSLVNALPVFAAPEISLSAISGYQGDSIVVSGTDFTSGDVYSIRFAPGTFYDQTLISNAVITGTSFNQTIMIPPAPWAQHTIRIDTNRGTFSRNFQILPQIELLSNQGYVGDTIVVNGAGFRATADVNIVFNDVTVATLATDAYGTLSQGSFKVPALRSGPYNVNGSDTAAATTVLIFSIRSRLISSITQGAVGDQITLNGSGFDYNSPITFYWDNQLIGTNQVVSSGNGTFSANFTIPTGTTGNHVIKAADFSARYASMNFNVAPSLALTPNISVPGSTVAITGQGFRLVTPITFTYNSLSLVTQPQIVTTDASGSFNATFTVPGGISGSYIVRATDGYFSAIATLNVALVIALSPSAGNVGMDLQVTGSGFTPSGSIVLSYEGQDMVPVVAGTDGFFSGSFKVPPSRAGARAVSARDLAAAGLIATATFTVESTPPPKPVLSAPPTDSQTGLTPKFAWSSVTDPSGVTYSLQISRDAAFSSVTLAKQGLTASEYTVTQAEALALTKKSASYYWRVKAIDGAGNESEWTAPFTFYTEDSTPPPVPQMTSPQNDSQAAVRPTFKWAGVTDVSGVTYSLQVSRNSAFTQIVLDKEGLTASSYQATQAEELVLTKKTSPYYWRVKATDGADNESAWTSAFTFYTQDSTPPAMPVALKPEPDSRQSGETQFNWSDVTDPSGVTYTLQVAQDAAFSRIIVTKESLPASEYKLGSAEKLSPSSGNPASFYYWRVKAVDGAGNESGWSSITEFTIKTFWQSGWLIYAGAAIAVLLLLALGIYIGLHLKKPAAK